MLLAVRAQALRHRASALGRALLLLSPLLLGLVPAARAGELTVAPAAEPPARVIVLTDIGADPDDTQSLVRLLLYANDIDIRGLVATTSVHQRTATRPGDIHQLLDRYAAVEPSLRRHDRRYPRAAVLRARVAAGQAGYGLGATGPGRNSPGAALIVRELDRVDPRPLWISVWGGANTLAQALQQLTRSRPAEAVARAVARLRVYAISDQDDAGAWLRRTYPQLFYIVSPGSYAQATWGGMFEVVEGIDNTPVGNAWLARHIQQGRGPLGAAYPDVTWGMEGDTPAFLSLIPNGLNAPEHPDWGGWGGRYELKQPRLGDTDPAGFNGGVPVEAEVRPIWTNAIDRYRPMVAAAHGRPWVPGEREFVGPRVTVWRWRDAVQNDFAARLVWTTRPYARANHPPTVRLAHAAELQVNAGDWVTLDASPSTDPDGDSLSHRWFHYPEPGAWASPIALGAENLARMSFQAPDVSQPQTAHLIVQVRDKGEPALTRYARVRVHVRPRAAAGGTTAHSMRD